MGAIKGGYLSVKNWSDYQQYKDRDPKWIKLHRDLLTDYEFDQLTEIQQNHLMKIWLLASKMDNKLPNDPAWIGRQIGAKSKVDINQLVTTGFLVPYICVQECTETYLETEEETETYREETERESAPSQKKPKRKTSLKPDLALPDDYRDYCTQKRPELDPDSIWEDFCDYYIGRGVTMADWKRTWQRWVREEKRGRNVPTRKSPQDRQREAAKLYLAGNNG